jgi:hypothetical protein
MAPLPDCDRPGLRHLGLPPAGKIDIDKAAWLVAALRTSSRKTAGAITREIMREAPEVDDEALQAVSVNSRRGRKIAAAPILAAEAETCCSS